jgi:hypothetical protein
LRALGRAVEWLRANEGRSRDELLRDLAPELRQGGLLPELVGPQNYARAEFDEKVGWMRQRGLLDGAPDYDAVVRNAG